ncbi:MAG: dihydrodipicolinate synthase family protein, partial [Candidatus Promineifilaceae bacterium]
MELIERIGELNQKLAGGTSPAMATPIDRKTGQVALDVIPKLVDFLISHGVRGLFVGGTTGEGIFLDVEQRKKLHEITVSAVAGRVPVLVHTGALTTETALDLAHHAAEIGADAMAAVTPIFYGMHEDALAGYFKAIANAAPQVPLFAYDIPHMAINGVSPGLARHMFEELPSMAGMKCSNPDAQAIRRLLDVIPEGRILLAGNEAIALGSLAMGAAGMISGLATAVPEPLVALTDAFITGDIVEARYQQRTINRLLAVIPAGVTDFDVAPFDE